MGPVYASVAISQPVEHAYTYLVPLALARQVHPGSLVSVPFGRRRVKGCVVAIMSTPPADVAVEKLKPISQVLTPGFCLDPELIALGRWISEYYMAPLGETLSCISFIGFNEVRSKVSQLLTLSHDWQKRAPAALLESLGLPYADESPALSKERVTDKQIAVIRQLFDAGIPMNPLELRNHTGAGLSVMQRLVQHGIAQWQAFEHDRLDDYEQDEQPDEAHDLNPAQAAALRQVTAAMDQPNAGKTFLVYGVTGSGKTEIYLQAISKALDEGGSAIVLVPEISLTPQTVSRFRRRFGPSVGVYHSKLTIGQKYDLWKRLRSGDCRVVIGARSAVFAPVCELRVLVIDEEHETSYKQDCSPRYNARDVAIVRAQACGATVILGSATPSVETYYKAQTGKFALLTLPERVRSYPMPSVHVIDMMREAKEQQNPELLSRELRAAIDQALSRREQVLLFINRRGFFSLMVCQDCNNVVRCEHCDVALTHHKARNLLMCHYCMTEYPMARQCPLCQGTDLSLLGLGTQRIEEHAAQLFPTARIARIDLDTMRRRTAFLETWRRIERHEVDIIIGTQMIAKGFHLENVTLVAVPLADVSLFQPDFRCAERAFSMLTQVAGRAGRGDKPGRVLIQTYVPNHYAVEYARSHDYIGFYEKEIRIRQVLRFPPFHRLISVLASGADSEHTAEMMTQFNRVLRDIVFRAQAPVSVLGPAPAPIARLRDEYRWRLLLRSVDHKAMKLLLRAALQRYTELPGYSKVMLTVDVDPQDLL